MNYKSDAQRAWAHTDEGMAALGKEEVGKLDKKSKGKDLPRFAKKKKRKTSLDLLRRLDDRITELASTVNSAGVYTKPSMRKRIFQRIKAGDKGGRPGQWSARKAQMLALQYKKAGGGYKE